MKTIVNFLILLAAVLTFAACEPEPPQMQHVRNIVYTVDEQTTTVQLFTEEEFDALLDRFCDYAEGGSSVTFRNANRTTKSTTKEAVTYSTNNRDEMKRWMAQMEAEGKTVTVTYDSQTGTWNGTAYANVSPSVPAGCITYATSNASDGHNYGIILTLDTVNHLAYITNGDAYLLHLGSEMPVHFPAGRFAYALSGNLLQLRTLNNKSSFDYNITITHQGNGLVLDWQTSGPCPSDHVHQATVYPTNRYQCLLCMNEAGEFLLHLDRNNYNSQKGQAWVKYRIVHNPQTHSDLPFYSCVFSLDVIMTYAETTYSTWTLSFPLSWLEGARIAEIENPGDNPEIWHVAGEVVTTENYNPMRDFDFQRIN